jgi:hypothetical protein
MNLAKTIAKSENMVDVCFVDVPHPMGMIPPDAIRKKAEDAFGSILEMASKWQTEKLDKAPAEAYPARRYEFAGSLEDINRRFFENGWSLGLPVFPPTPERVARMLAGTDRKPDEVLALAPPENATLTVELVAVHAAMAGCKPEYMPVLIAALEALLTPEVNWVGTLTTTGTTQFIIIVNGPVVKELGIGCAQGSAGKGYHPNAAIGYAVNLIAYGVGGSRPPEIDRSTLASPGDYVCWVFGENEDRLPEGWEPLHVDQGFDRTDSAVTVLSSYPPIENIDHWSVTTDEHLRWWGYIVNGLHNVGGPAISLIMDQRPIIAIGPEHAELVASLGWSKYEFRKAFWEQTRIPLSAWPAGCKDTGKLVEKLGSVTPETLIPITLKPEQLVIAIGGGDGKHSHYFPPFPGSHTVSRLIKT